VVIYSFEATGDFAPTFVSKNISDIFGYRPHEYLESPDFWRECVHPDDLAAVEAEAAHLFRNGRHTVEYRFRRKDGTYRWVHDEQRVIVGADGAPSEIVGSWSDITDRRLAQEAALTARERVDRLLATSPAVIYSFDATGEFAPTYISQNVKDLLGYDREEYLFSPDFWVTRVHPDDMPRLLPAREQLMDTGRLSNEYRFRRKDGSYCWVSDEQRIVRDALGRPVEVVGAWSDLTTRSQAELALSRSEQRLTDAIEAIAEGFALFDAEDRLIACNRAYGEMLGPGTDTPRPGTTYEALIRTEAQLGLVEDAKGRVEEWVAERLADHRAPVGVHLRCRADGRWIRIEERKTTEGGTVAVHTDITRSKLAEKELRAAYQEVEEANARAMEVPIRTEIEGLRLDLDPDKLDRAAAANVLGALLVRLRG
jgi:PAS domain S-box-containing protein